MSHIGYAFIILRTSRFPCLEYDDYHTIKPADKLTGAGVRVERRATAEELTFATNNLNIEPQTPPDF